MKEPKFKIGAILKHKSMPKLNCHRLLVIETGTLGESIIYGVSFEKQFTSTGEASHVRAFLFESEVELFDTNGLNQ